MTRLYGLDLNLLVTLDVLLVERNLTHAAERLNLTQPAISNALTKLREHFDDELLVRNGREMERTPFAQQMSRPLQEALQHLRTLALARPRFDPASASRLYKIVASDYITTILMGDFILHLEQLAPHVKLEQLPLNDDSVGKISLGEADAIIWPHGPRTPTTFATRSLFTETFVCIASCVNSQAGAVLSREEFYGLKRAVPPYKMYWPNSTQDKDQAGCTVSMPFSAIPWFVSRSDYVALVPERLAAMYERLLPLRRIALTPAVPSVAFSVQCHPDSFGDPFKVWMLDQLQAVAAIRCPPSRLSEELVVAEEV